MTIYESLKKVLQDQLSDLIIVKSQNWNLFQAGSPDVVDHLEGLQDSLAALCKEIEATPFKVSSYEKLAAYWQKTLRVYFLNIKAESTVSKIDNYIPEFERLAEMRRLKEQQRASWTDYEELEMTLQEELAALIRIKKIPFLEEIEEKLNNLFKDIRQFPITQFSYERLKDYWEETARAYFYESSGGPLAVNTINALISKKESPVKIGSTESKTLPSVSVLPVTETIELSAPTPPAIIRFSGIFVALCRKKTDSEIFDEYMVESYNKLKAKIEKEFTPSRFSGYRILFQLESALAHIHKKIAKIEKEIADPFLRYEALATYCRENLWRNFGGQARLIERAIRDVEFNLSSYSAAPKP